VAKALVRILVAIVDAVVRVVFCAIVVSELDQAFTIGPVGARGGRVRSVVCLNMSARLGVEPQRAYRGSTG
jgi:hypothetical protein